MKVLRNNLVVQFSVVSFAVMATVAVILALELSAKVRTDAINDLVDEAVGSSSGRVIGALTPEDLKVPMTGERYDRFHEFVQRSVVSDWTARIKAWASDGTVIYSDDPFQIGEEYPDKENLLKSLQGEFPVEIVVPGDADNDLDRYLGTLMALYVPITFPGATKPEGSFEIYQYFAPTAARISSMRRWVIGGIALGFGALYMALVYIVWGGWRTINRQQTQLASFTAELEDKIEERTEEIEKIQDQLLDSNRLAAIGELAGGVAHELLSPLSAIKMAAYYLKRKLKERDTQSPHDLSSEDRCEEFLDLIDDTVNRSARTIDSLIDYARAPVHKTELADIPQLVEKSIASVNSNGSIEVSKEFERDPPAVPVDVNMVSKALTAIFENAKESMPNGGTLRITAREADGYLVVEIRDNGLGMSPSDLARAFDPLFSTHNRGVGLGLPVAQQVVKGPAAP